MAATYSGNPDSSTRDAVRYFLQDTREGRWLLQDPEIDFEIKLATAITGSENCGLLAASHCATVIASRFAAAFDISADGVSTGASGLQAKYTDLANALMERHIADAGAGASPYVAGVDPFECPDFSVRPGQFGVGMDDNYEAGRQNYGGRGRMPEYSPLEGGFG